MSNRFTVFFVLFLTLIGQSSMDIYLPSMPHMVATLHTTITWVQLSLPFFLLAYGGCQLIYGPLTDRFGRSLLLKAGLSLYLLATLVCIFSTTIHTLLIGRLLQGLGAGAASIVSRAIMRDVFTGKALARVSAQLGMTWAMVPILAPIVGGYIQHYAGWHGNFVAMLLTGGIGLLLTLFLYKETHNSNHQQPLTLKSILSNYHTVLCSRMFMANATPQFTTYGALIAYLVAAPFLIQSTLGYSAIAFGWIACLIGGGNWLGSRFSKSFSQTQRSLAPTAQIALFLIFLLSVLLYLFSVYHILSLAILIAPIFLMNVAGSITYPICLSASLDAIPKLSGSASALLGFGGIFIGGIVGTVMAHFPKDSAMPLSIVLCILSLIGYLVFSLLRKYA